MAGRTQLTVNLNKIQSVDYLEDNIPCFEDAVVDDIDDDEPPDDPMDGSEGSGRDTGKGKATALDVDCVSVDSDEQDSPYNSDTE